MEKATDNYYSSPELFADLLKKNTFARGTVRQNRKLFPETLKSRHNKLEVGQYHFARCGQMVIVLWHDRRDVHVLSIAHNRSAGSVMERPKGSQEKVPVACPTCVADYNSFMGGVDLTDQYLSYYSLTNRKMVKWWKLFWRLVDICILNSFIIYRHNFLESNINTH